MVTKSSFNFFLFILVTIGPAVSIVLALIGYPLIYTISLSFFNRSIIHPEPRFVFISNYISLLSSPTFYRVLYNTLYWTALNVVATTGLGLITAILLADASLKGLKIFRPILLIPWAISVPGYVTWVWMMNSDYGIFNEILKSLGLISHYISWLSEGKLALIGCTIANTWHMYPYMCSMILAGILSIPNEILEAANIDGAGSLKRFLYITLPLISPNLLVAMCLYTIWTMNSFAPYIMIPGGLGGAAETLPIYAYKMFFQRYEFSKGATAASILFMMNLALAVSYLRFLMRRWK